MKKTDLLHQVLAVLCVFGVLGCSDKDKPDKPEKKLIQYTVGQSLEASFFAPQDTTHAQLESFVQQGLVDMVEVASVDGSSVYCLSVAEVSASHVYEMLKDQRQNPAHLLTDVQFVDDCTAHSDLE